MSRVRTNTIRSYNTDTVSVENPTLTGQITANGVRVYFGMPANGQVIAYDATAQTYRPMTVSTDGGVTDGVTRLPQLLDVILATDDNGNTLVPDGSFLRFNNDPNHEYDGFWTATTVHDGGEY